MLSIGLHNFEGSGVDQYVCNTLLQMVVKMAKFTYLRKALRNKIAIMRELRVD